MSFSSQITSWSISEHIHDGSASYGHGSKELEIPSGHDPNKYVVERIKAKSHDGRMIPISLLRLKNKKQDGKSKILLYAYGAYKHSISPSFSASRFCLVDRGITFAIAHVRGGGDLGDTWHTEGKMKLKKNTFLD